jgi:hypothetical protein
MDSVLDRALARYANVQPPAGLEGRILAKIEKRKAHSRKRIEAACILAAAALSIMPVLLRVDSGNSASPVIAAEYSHVPDWSSIDQRHPRFEPVFLSSPKPAPPAERQQRPSTLIADFRIEPVKLSDVRMSSISDSQ